MDRKTNQIVGIDKALPVLVRKKYKSPDSLIRSNFEDWTQGNTVDNTYTFDQFDLPTDPAQCSGVDCPPFFGYLTVDNTGVTLPQLTETFAGDYTDYFSGAFKFFVKTSNNADAGKVVQVEIAASQAELGVNSDEYTFILPETAPSEVAIVIDLSQVPNAVNGTGWDKADDTGFAVQITMPVAPVGTVGFSSFEIYEEFTQVATPRLVKLFCLDAIGLNRSFTATPSPCNEISKITETAYEFTMTVQANTDDIAEVMPNATRETNTTVLRRKTATKEVEAYTDPNTGITYGKISLPSITSEVCAAIDVLVTSQCLNGGPRVLEELIIRDPNQSIDDGYFHVERGTYDATITNIILVSDVLVGETIQVDYYTDEVGTLVTETDTFENVETRMYWDLKDAKGRYRTVEIPQAVITGFNETLGRTDPLSYELTVQVSAVDGEYLKQHIAYA